MKHKKGGFLKRQYSLSWDFLKESKNFIWAIVGVFVAFALIGYFVPAPIEIQEQILKFIEELLAKTADMSHLELTQFIFLNNLQSSFMGMVLGVFLGIFSIVAAIMNGYLIGFVSNVVVAEEGIFVLWRLLPHGIFELPAIFISLGLGIKLASFIGYDEKFVAFKELSWNCLRVFIFVVFPLLVIAAIIEGSLIFFVG